MDLVIPYLATCSYLAERTARRRRYRHRVYRERLNYDILSQEDFHKHFRLSRTAINDLYEKLQQVLDGQTQRSCAIPGFTKLLSVLYCFGTGIFQHCVASRFGFTQPCFSKILRQVLNAIISVVPEYIIFPETMEAISETKQGFKQVAGMPNVLGLIDCTHIPFKPPSDSAVYYKNRKMFTSINVQVVINHDMMITDIVARFPGSTHDAYIFDNSRLAERLENGDFGSAFLLGDNGYRLSPWLMTPFLHPTSSCEHQFNEAHRRTRSAVERLFGIWKSRFRCLDVSGGAMLYSPEITCKIIMACAVLQNIANKQRLPVDLADDLREHITAQGEEGESGSLEGQAVRHQIAENYFN